MRNYAEKLTLFFLLRFSNRRPNNFFRLPEWLHPRRHVPVLSAGGAGTPRKALPVVEEILNNPPDGAVRGDVHPCLAGGL